MGYLRLSLVCFFLLVSCTYQKPEQSKEQTDIERIIRTLSADDMEGRATFTPGIDKAAIFIENEYRKIGLKPIDGESRFRQQFSMEKVTVGNQRVVINGKNISDDALFVITDLPKINCNRKSGIQVLYIKAGQNFQRRYEGIIKSVNTVLVLVDETFRDDFRELQNQNSQGRFVLPKQEKLGAAIFVLGIKKLQTFEIRYRNQVKKLSLFNVVGIIPGKSKSNELVIFSAHYDHLGIIKPTSLIYNLMRLRIRQLTRDSVANGADDDASGVTAVISLAKYYKKLNNNERTLIFVAFTAEEIGGFGSRYFAKKLDPSDVVAMINIEKIGKKSKFGKNSAFITGYEKSDFGKILQRNLGGTDFKFYPDPYPKQNLFFRSDNASLAVLGVPAHTISTSQIDKDEFYHTVKDEFNTLDLTNITATINAIELSSRSIVAGTDSPRRILGSLKAL